MNKFGQNVKTQKNYRKALYNGLSKQRSLFVGLIVIGFMFASFPLTSTSKVLAGPTTPWNVVDAYWGTMAMPMDVSPGDQNVPLSIIVQYVPDDTSFSATGIVIKLDLEQHFTALIGTDPVATPTLLSVSATQSQMGPFKPGDVGIVEYVLNIHPIALIGHPYKMELRVEYFKDKTGVGGDLEYKIDKVPFEVRILGRPRFEVDFLGGPLVAEQDNSLSVKITNYGSAAANDVNVELTLPPPLILTEGGNHWEIGQISVQDTYELGVTIYAPKLSVASTYQLTLLVTYRDQSGNIQSETHYGGMVVHGNTEQPTSDLKLEFSVDKIKGGRSNPFSLQVSNFGVGNAYDATITIELPPPLIMMGTDNHWYVENILSQSSQEINITIYAPEAAIGYTYPVAVTLTFKDHTGVEQMEIRQLGLLVIGDIDLLVYEFVLYPPEVPVGGNFTLSGSLLNQGNVEAMYCNLTLVEDATFRTTPLSTYYVGQVDPNAPIPFALTGFLQEEVGEGTYSLTILVSYRDNFGGQYTLTKTTAVSVIRVESSGTAVTPQPSVIQQISDTFFRPIPLFVTFIVIVALWRILRKKEEE